MRYLITKLFRSTPDGYSEPATIRLERAQGAKREITGHVGSPGTDGEHVTELNGTGGLVIRMDERTVLCIVPLE